METSGLERDDVNFLSLLSGANRRRLLEGSTRAVWPAGTIAYRRGEPPAAFLLDRGLLRAYWAIPDGRQATVAFVHRNELVGGSTLFGEPAWANVQVVIESRLTALDLKRFRKLVSREIQVLSAVARHLMTRVRHDHRLIAVRSLGSIRERLAYDLLERACQSQLQVGRLQINVTQADLAASIGSSREVVSRALKGFRAAGIVKTAPGVVRVADPMRLAAIVRDFAM